MVRQIIHRGYAIPRIRAFYIRKVKFTAQNFHDKISTILDQFPKLDDIHPFYHDLINVLYDRDHYKLALGQLNRARHLIDQLANDYVRLIKYGDSLFRCKQLKRAAMGRMCTLMKGQNASLRYLEQVRQHLARLPAIDPTARSLLVCGYPNVGKSSFMNSITRADVDVQPYAFTTKSLFVGHTDHQYLPWQVIDTPGVLDHPLEERNTIEMQSIMALAHLQATVMFFVDVSEQCGYTVDVQLALFDSLRPLFTGKPLFLVMTKVDVVVPEQLPAEQWAKLRRCWENTAPGETPVEHACISNLTSSGVGELKVRACNALLTQRVDRKLRSKRVQGVVNRLHVAQPPSGTRGPPLIPKSVRAEQAAGRRPRVQLRHASRSRRVQGVRQSLSPPAMDVEVEDLPLLVRDEEAAGGGPGRFVFDWRRHHLLEREEWRQDRVPEIYDGHNVADWVDPEIEARLDALDQEEEELVAVWQAAEDAAGPVSTLR